jgi:acetylornithine deacetylase
MNKLPDLQSRIAQLIQCPSISCADPRLDQSNLGVIHLLAEWAETIGFTTEIESVAPGKANLIATLGPSPSGRLPGGLVFSGHTDTVPCNPDLWHSDPFTATLRDDRIYGLGSCDMKGFFALALEAASKFKASDLREPLILVGTCDEESSMSGARQLLASARHLGRKAVIGEPTNLRPIRVHKGVMMESIRVRGRSGHSSDPSLGANAILGMQQVLETLIRLQNELKENHRHAAFKVDYPTLNLGAIHGGDSPNRICGHCELLIDIRPLPGMQLEAVQALVSERLSGVISAESGLSLEVSPLFPGLPPFETAADAELTQFLEQATGEKAGAVAFGTEAPFFNALGLETLIIGPGSIDQAHQPDEFLSLAQINPGVRLLEDLIVRYCKA